MVYQRIHIAVKDFEYEITKEGFVLRCQGKEFQGRLMQLLKFKVKG